MKKYDDTLESFADRVKRKKASPENTKAAENKQNNSEKDQAEKENPDTTEEKPLPPTHLAPGNKSDGFSSGKLALGIIAVLLIGVFINTVSTNYNKNNNNNNRSTNIPSTLPQSSISPGPGVKSATKSELTYTKPPEGTSRVLSVPQIRWCVREGIRIDTMRDIVDSRMGLDGFNRIVDDYNGRCGRFKYRPGSLKRAERDVESERFGIVSEARQRDLTLGQVNPSSNKPKLPSARDTKEAQQLLTQLGYKPGPIDGMYGRNTADAVKKFQGSVGLVTDGWIDRDLLSSLKSEVSSRREIVERVVDAQAYDLPPVAPQKEKIAKKEFEDLMRELGISKPGW